MVAYLLDRKLEVWRAVASDDGAGGLQRTLALHGTAWARLPQPTAVEQHEADQATARHDQTVYLAWNADVARGDELRTATGDRFEVQATVAPSRPGVYLRADCERLQPEEG